MTLPKDSLRGSIQLSALRDRRTSASVLPAIEDGVFELPGSPPTWIWVSTCPNKSCDCRALYVLATTQGRLVLLQRLDMLLSGVPNDFRRKTQHLADLLHFMFDLDTAAASDVLTDGKKVDLTDHPQVNAITRRIDGDLLDRVEALWHRGRGAPSPEEGVIAAEQIPISWWRPGGHVWWHWLCPSARRDIYILGGKWYEASERYMPAHGCNWQYVVVGFNIPFSPPVTYPGEVVVHASGHENVHADFRGKAIVQRLWAAFRSRHPEYRTRFSRRYNIVRDATPRFVVPNNSPRTLQ